MKKVEEIWRQLRGNMKKVEWRLRKVEKSWSVWLDCSLRADTNVLRIELTPNCNWWEVDRKLWSSWILKVALLILKKAFSTLADYRSDSALRYIQVSSPKTKEWQSPLDAHHEWPNAGIPASNCPLCIFLASDLFNILSLDTSSGWEWMMKLGRSPTECV